MEQVSLTMIQIGIILYVTWTIKLWDILQFWKIKDSAPNGIIKYLHLNNKKEQENTNHMFFFHNLLYSLRIKV